MRYELSDHEWGIIGPMLPNKPRGVRSMAARWDRIMKDRLWLRAYESTP